MIRCFVNLDHDARSIVHLGYNVFFVLVAPYGDIISVPGVVMIRSFVSIDVPIL